MAKTSRSKRRNVYGASRTTSMLAKGLAATTREHYDGLFLTRIVPHAPTNEVLVTREQPSRSLILDQAQRLRNEPEALRPLSFGVWALTIPFEDLENLEAANPELKSTDKETRRRAWRKFIASPESLPYRVKERP